MRHCYKGNKAIGNQISNRVCINIALTPYQFEQLSSIADTRRLSFSAVLREAVATYLGTEVNETGT